MATNYEEFYAGEGDEPEIILKVSDDATFEELQEAALFLFEILEEQAAEDLRDAEGKMAKRPVFGNEAHINQIKDMTEARILYAKVNGAYKLLNEV